MVFEIGIEIAKGLAQGGHKLESISQFGLKDT